MASRAAQCTISVQQLLNEKFNDLERQENNQHLATIQVIYELGRNQHGNYFSIGIFCKSGVLFRCRCGTQKKSPGYRYVLPTHYYFLDENLPDFDVLVDEIFKKLFHDHLKPGK